MGDPVVPPFWFCHSLFQNQPFQWLLVNLAAGGRSQGPWDTCWLAPGSCVGKSWPWSATWSFSCVTKLSGGSYKLWITWSFRQVAKGQVWTVSDIVAPEKLPKAQNWHIKWSASDNIRAGSNKHHNSISKGRSQQTLKSAEVNSTLFFIIFFIFFVFYFLFPFLFLILLFIFLTLFFSISYSFVPFLCFLFLGFAIFFYFSFIFFTVFLLMFFFSFAIFSFLFHIPFLLFLLLVFLLFFFLFVLFCFILSAPIQRLAWRGWGWAS